MNKSDLLRILEPFDDSIDIWMEVDAGIAPVGDAEYLSSSNAPYDDAVILLTPTL